MKVGEVVRFQEERFFNGAVQLGWVQQQRDLAEEVASAFVFHGPRYHGADDAGDQDLQTSYRLIDTASFVLELLRIRDQACGGADINPFWLAIAGYGSGKSHLSVTLSRAALGPHGADRRDGDRAAAQRGCRDCRRGAGAAGGPGEADAGAAGRRLRRQLSSWLGVKSDRFRSVGACRGGRRCRARPVAALRNGNGVRRAQLCAARAVFRPAATRPRCAMRSARPSRSRTRRSSMR